MTPGFYFLREWRQSHRQMPYAYQINELNTKGRPLMLSMAFVDAATYTHSTSYPR